MSKVEWLFSEYDFYNERFIAFYVYVVTGICDNKLSKQMQVNK